MTAHRLALLCAASPALSACGGTKLVRRPAPLAPPERAIAVAADATLATQLDFIVVRNRLVAWAKNGDWDEYLLRVRNASASPVEIRSVEVTDSSGHTSIGLNDQAPCHAPARDHPRGRRCPAGHVLPDQPIASARHSARPHGPRRPEPLARHKANTGRPASCSASPAHQVKRTCADDHAWQPRSP